MVVHHRRTRDGAQLELSVLVILMLVINNFLGISVAIAQSTDKYAFQIESLDAFPDSTLPDRLRQFFDDGNDSPLECASIDLNSDGKVEKFIPQKLLEGTGLCPWLVFDSGLKHVIGRFDAKVIIVCKTKQRGYAILECYCKEGGGLGSVTSYAFNGHEYKKTSFTRLQNEQIYNYFEQRKNVPHPR